ncbi:ATP-binding protein [Oscillatoria sp. FACHB-1406]|uniref:AlbA family DNA-binding domain-containing protein n=1 Tax=Oscillatoria sp. FACHB-1406 TaxID=2692846 RepID=UPI001F5488D5|nr:ATP-binding protein [Oscillatoria sp. FACHB-1406]
MITLNTLQDWLNAPVENEKLEFKEAKNQFDTVKLMKYCVAIANEGGGYLIFGITDKRPRQVVGSHAFSTPESLNKIKAQIVKKLHLRVDTTELQHSDGRVLIFEIPSRPTGQPIALDGAYLMRAGEELVAMTSDMLKRIFAEDRHDWFCEPAASALAAGEVIDLLDTQTYFELLKLPYPTHRNAVLERLQSDRLLYKMSDGWTISNISAILLAKKLERFSSSLARKAARVIFYEGSGK